MSHSAPAYEKIAFGVYSDDYNVIHIVGTVSTSAISFSSRVAHIGSEKTWELILPSIVNSSVLYDGTDNNNRLFSSRKREEIINIILEKRSKGSKYIIKIFKKIKK